MFFSYSTYLRQTFYEQVRLRSFHTAWVRNRPDGLEMRLPVLPPKQTPVGHRAMSEKCQKRKSGLLPDHLVRACEQRVWHLHVQHLCRSKVDDEFQLGR